MEEMEQLIAAYGAYMKDLADLTENLVCLENVPRYVIQMELKAIIRNVQKLCKDTEGHIDFIRRINAPSPD